MTAANALGPMPLACARMRAGSFAIEEKKVKDTKHGGTYRPTCNCIPLTLSTCGDYFANVQDLVKELSKLKAETAEDYLEASNIANQLGVQALETGRLRHRRSKVLQNVVANRTFFGFVGCQHIVDHWSRKPSATT